jgi:hypothetical protein
MKARKGAATVFKVVDGVRRAVGRTTGKAWRRLNGRIKSWESIDENERTAGAFKKPGAMRP